ncbi:MAG: putative zinc-binding peptidase [Ramlibacter sp.]
MKLFHCDNCGNALFFENVKCLHCGSDLAFLPTRMAMAAIEQVPDAQDLWRRKKPGKEPSVRHFRLCQNNTEQQACNFAVPDADPNPLCVCCRLTQVLPDLSVPGNHERWCRIETSKRRLFYTLARLGLVSVNPPDGTRDGPVFQFLADQPGQQVMTGHLNGVITLNVAEADDDERVRRRLQLREPYRTLLGHLRHESGHYYWDGLIRGAGRQEEFRAVFGDEEADYGAALQSHYASGAPASWQENFVSAYASAHPWEDWAETWAHYLHMVDLLETAASYNTRLAMPGAEDEADAVTNPFAPGANDFEVLVDQWVPLTLLVNSLNRSLGQDDAYPFALSKAALNKLRFIHDLIQSPHAPLGHPEPAVASQPGEPAQAQPA